MARSPGGDWTHRHTTQDIQMHEQQLNPRSRGYSPLWLTLTGFQGIRSGLGRDTITLDIEALAGDAELVALAGKNGRGKTTIMDNLHPYMTMPSRAGADGTGAFSYYDHLCLPESGKELGWSHDDRTFKSQLVFRCAGKRKATEAYLLERFGEEWVPVTLSDGTKSDGKVETYERAVVEILGPAETFFTSGFSAQNKRALSAYKNSEIKSLLADMLGLEAVREKGGLANDVARQLKAGLGVLRQTQANLTDLASRLQRDLNLAGDVGAKHSQAVSVKKSADAALAQARETLAELEKGKAADVTSAQRRGELVEERQRAEHAAQSAMGRVQTEKARLTSAVEALETRIATRRRLHAEKRDGLVRRERDLRSVSDMAARVQHAQRRRPLVDALVTGRDDRRRAAASMVERLDGLKAQERVLAETLQGIHAQAGQITLRQADLQRRFGLAKEVPCAGTDLQGQCKLLCDANEAKQLLPSVDAQIQQLSERRRTVVANAAELKEQIETLAKSPATLGRADALLARACERQRKILALCAKEGEVRQAGELLQQVREELSRTEAVAPELTEEEGRERVSLSEALATNAEEATRIQSSLRETIERVEKALMSLPKPFDESSLKAASQAVGEAERRVREAEQAVEAAVRQQEQVKAMADQLQDVRRKQRALGVRATRVQDALANWVLTGKCMSNDGLIALDIDDAGPAISGLANDLLLECYGERFTLSVTTQSETAKGEMREDFDILVHDGSRGETKSLRMVSGGERVWINECLTRAIALHLAQHTGRSYGTLFGDELDGPLDPERKRMFIQMKRAVLRIGNYRREFYVSQTPELTQMADKVINLDELVLEGEGAIA